MLLSLIFFTFIFNLATTNATAIAQQSEILNVTKSFPRYFKDELIKVAFYHELIVRQRSEHNRIRESAMDVCMAAIKNIANKAIAAVGNLTKFAGDLDTAITTTATNFVHITKEITSLEKESFASNEFKSSLILDRNDLIAVVHSSIVNDAMVELSVNRIKFFKFGIFALYLHVQLFSLMQCAEVAAVLKGENGFSVNSTQLELKLEDLSRQIQSFLPVDTLSVPKGSEYTCPYKFLQKRYVTVRDLTGLDKCEKSCEDFEPTRINPDICKNRLYNCTTTEHNSLMLISGNDRLETSFGYTCVKAGNIILYGTEISCKKRHGKKFH